MFRRKQKQERLLLILQRINAPGGVGDSKGGAPPSQREVGGERDSGRRR